MTNKKPLGNLSMTTALMGPLQLGSRDHNFPKNLWKEHMENTKMAKFEVPSIKERDFMTV